MVYEVLGNRCVTVTAVTFGPYFVSGEPLPLHLTAYLSRGILPVWCGADHVRVMLLHVELTEFTPLGGFGATWTQGSRANNCMCTTLVLYTQYEGLGRQLMWAYLSS